MKSSQWCSSKLMSHDSALELVLWVVIKHIRLDAAKNVSWAPDIPVTYGAPNELCPAFVEPEHGHMATTSASTELVEQVTMRLRQCNHVETPTR